MRKDIAKKIQLLMNYFAEDNSSIDFKFEYKMDNDIFIVRKIISDYCDITKDYKLYSPSIENIILYCQKTDWEFFEIPFNNQNNQETEVYIRGFIEKSGKLTDIYVYWG